MIEINPKPLKGFPPSIDPSQPGTDERLALLGSVLASRTFAKSSRLAQFLKFICTQTIAGNAKEINEQQIGVHVFARSPAYIASDDSIVRTQARLLRQRLEEYFEHEAPSSSLIITIPKGGYVPVFELRNAAAPQRPELSPAREGGVLESAGASEKSEEPAAAAPSRRFRRVWVISAMAVLLVLAVVAGISLTNHQSRSASDVLWAKIFKEGRPVVIVPSDDALVLFEEVTKTPVPLDQYLSGSYLDRKDLPASSPLALTSDWFAAHQYTSTADLNLALRLGRLPAGRNTTVETRNARVLRIDDLKSRNVILIGGKAANPWVGLFSNRLNFEVNYDWKTAEGYVLNKHPAKGEASVYYDKVIDGTRHSYGVLAFLPGIEDEGESLLFEGTGMAGTESASDFPFNSSAFTTFAQQIGAAGNQMPYFEALLETTSVGGNAPEVHVLTYHRIKP
ncbi:hypothetical protein [Acidicapsa ligni]|uniref:hypothetical protein n=1 Tax=Acidicapsa ligni TaxID=542300 RepID=UPI0021DFFC8D|nr:hypothetical protein [Acidicapsa ligni]